MKKSVTLQTNKHGLVAERPDADVDGMVADMFQKGRPNAQTISASGRSTLGMGCGKIVAWTKLENPETRAISAVDIRDMVSQKDVFNTQATSALGRSTDDFGNSFRNLFKNFWRKGTNFAAYQSLVDSDYLADEHDSFSEQAGAFLFRALDCIVSAFRRGFGLRSERNQDNVFARTVERIGRNNQCGTLLERTEISKWKRNEDDVTALIADHISNHARYSKIQMTVLRASEARERQHQGRLVSATAQVIAVDLRALTFLLPVQFGLRSDFAYARSIPNRTRLSI